MERLLKCWGQIESWTRAKDANGKPKTFGYWEFEDVEGAVICYKVMNGLKVNESNLIVS